MEDLSGITVPKIPVTEGFPFGVPGEIIDGLSGASQIDAATRLMGFENEKEAPCEGSE